MAKPSSGTIFGHPKGLYVLFFTELWERFSFYGMKTLLMLYMINHFFWTQEDASSLMGTYGMLAYGLPVVGGFLADRFLGQRRAIILGAILLSAGHLCMVFEPLPFFYTALGLIIAGVALLKPNISTQVGGLYEPGDPRRDGAFTIFYMGINIGAIIGPLLCTWLKDNYGWHYGFGAAGVGMFLGLIVYVIGQRKLVEFNQDAPAEKQPEPTPEPDVALARNVDAPHVVRDRVIVLCIVCLFQILFWTAFEQSPNAMLVWADKHTNLRLASSEPPPVTLDDASSGTEEEPGIGAAAGAWFSEPTVSSGHTQSFNGIFIVTIAPLIALIWVWLDRRGRQPSTPAKMVLGLIAITMAFGIMWPAAQLEGRASNAPLTNLPTGLHVDEENRVYSDDPRDGDRVYYGATRLQFDGATGQLTMQGVFVDLDRIRILATTAPRDLAAEVEAFVESLADKDFSGQPATITLQHAPPGLADVEIKESEGNDPKTLLTWDAQTKTLTALDRIGERTQTEFIAAAADPAFKIALDAIYIESSRFRVTVWWLIGFYLLLTVGELCISPVGLSLVTKLAPAKNVGLFMGLWFLATAISEKTAHVFGSYWGKMPPDQYFVIFVVMCAIGAVFMAVLVPAMTRMTHGAD